MTEPVWIDKTALILLVGETLSDHGGAQGLRDEGLLESALARPVNLHAYENDASIARLAAAYGYGVAKNHPFIDGNKRAGLIAIGLFLKANGYNLVAPQIDAFQTILQLAAGGLGEDELADWIGKNIKPR